METNSTDSTLGSQGTQDFTSMISTAGGQGPSQGGKSAVPGGSTGPSGVPTKSLAQIEAEQQAGQTGGETPGSTAQPSQAGNQVQAGQGTGEGQTNQPGQPGQQQSQADIIKATADAIVNAQNAANLRAQQNQPRQPDKPLTAEEFNTKYKVARAQPELVQLILGNDPVKAAAALNQYGQNLVQQAVLMTLDLARSETDKIRGDFHPHIQAWQQHQQQVQAQQAEHRFFATHTDLAAEKDLVLELKDAFIAKVQAGQIRFENEAQAFSTVANAARNILQRIRGTNGGPGANGQGGTNGGQGTQNGTGQSQGQSSPGRQMSAASSAGRTGTGQAIVKTDGEQIFGSDWR